MEQTEEEKNAFYQETEEHWQHGKERRTRSEEYDPTVHSDIENLYHDTYVCKT